MVSSSASALQVVAGEALSCTRCELYRRATQTVFGEGPVPAELMMVGEQPGDQEDRQGRPFVGPAGRVLDGALDTAGLDRSDVYITNAVKHFKWEERGKRRIHKQPSASEMVACTHWLEQEIDLVDPQVLLVMGATAVGAVFEGRPTVSSLRGTTQVSRFGVPAIVTVHPAAIVRLRDHDERSEQLAAFVGDLTRAVDVAAASNGGAGDNDGTARPSAAQRSR
jgi:uracil-DNA glycosylase family protein